LSVAKARTISHHELVDDLSALLARAEAGEVFLITMEGRPMAKLRPFVESSRPEGDVHGLAGGSSSNSADA